MPEHDQMPTDDDTSLERPAKRKRVALACETCRDRKVRCDGGKPVCRPCAKRADCSLPCVYSVISSSAKQVSEKEYIASLQRQVQDLTQVIDAIGRRVQGSNYDDPSAPAQQVSRVRSGTSSRPRSPTNDAIHDPTSRIAFPLPTVHGRDDDDAYLRSPSPSQMGNEARPVNAMGASMAVQTESPDTPSQDGVYYGQSSVHSLLQHVPRPSPAIVTPAGGTQHPPRRQERRMPPQERAQERVDSLLQPEYALPPRSMASTLLHLYLENIHVFYPWVHSPSFCSRFEALWESDGLHDVTTPPSAGDVGLGGSKCPPRTFYCAVNAMFALGCEFSDFPDRQAASATFYRRVRRLLDSDILDSSSVSLVQVLLLVGHYLLTTQYPTRCYNMIGLACRMAVGLGLHLDKPGPGHMETETQMRRRLWHGCVQMETFVSMTLGRPPFFTTGNHVSLPDAVDDVYLPAQGESPGQPSHVFSQNLFTVINIKFAKILGMILRRIYHPAQQDTPSQTERLDVNTLLHLDLLLQDVRKDIPAPIDWDCLPASDTAPRSSKQLLLRRQANVLQARWLHIRVLLYRPSFTSFCEAARPREQPNQPVDSGLANALNSQCAEVCVKYACELVESVSRATSEKATGAWWFSLLYLITSGVIIILAECTQLHKKPAFDGPTLARSWDLCITTLECLGAKHERAREYLQSLRILRERASQAYGVPGGQPPPATVQVSIGNVDGAQAGRPEQRQAEGVCDTYEDVPWNSDAVYGTGFLEHDWGAPFLFENMGENWWEGQETSTCFPHEGGLQDHIA